MRLASTTSLCICIYDMVASKSTCELLLYNKLVTSQKLQVLVKSQLLSHNITLFIKPKHGRRLICFKSCFYFNQKSCHKRRWFINSKLREMLSFSRGKSKQIWFYTKFCKLYSKCILGEH